MEILRVARPETDTLSVEIAVHAELKWVRESLAVSLFWNLKPGDPLTCNIFGLD